MIQSVGEEWRGIDGKFEPIRVSVCGQRSSTGTKQSWSPLVKDDFFQRAGKGLAGATHREPEHFITALRAPPPRLLPLAAGSVPPPALPMAQEPQLCPAGGLPSRLLSPGAQAAREGALALPVLWLPSAAPSSFPAEQRCSCGSPAPSSEQPRPRAAAGLAPGRDIKSGWCRPGRGEELRALSTWLSRHAVNCVPKVAAALSLLALESSGACKVFKSPLEILQSRPAKGRREMSWKLISSFC